MLTGLYRHYKGGYYQLLGVGEHTETNERVAVYVSLSMLPGPRIRVCPLEKFKEGIEVAPGQWVHRFMPIGDEVPTGISMETNRALGCSGQSPLSKAVSAAGDGSA